MIQIPELKIDGFAMSHGLAGETVKVAIYDWMTSDDPDFFVIVRQLVAVLSHALSPQGIYLDERGITDLVLVLHVDRSATLYIGQLSITLEASAKREIKAGEVVTQADVADVRRLRIGGIATEETDRVIVCTRIGWKFCLFYDLRRDKKLDVDGMEKRLAHLYRLVHFEAAYAAMGDEALKAQLLKDGWFPFTEIIATEFPRLVNCYRNNFNIEGEVAQTVAAFDANRIERVRSRWASSAAFVDRMGILNPALNAFIGGDYVSCIKNIATEIEGILRDAHFLEKGEAVKTAKLIDFARDRGVRKAESEHSLFLPLHFRDFLRLHTFADFDPNNPTHGIVSRHAIGHGAARAADYTKTAAVQYILTIDQLALYL